ncbi:MAG: PEGA domain-containing protein [Candidatus Levybacteria bacterium]|nr:PEGA domain-containing protein [Candidatus Levybacteria bacterium]
MRKLLFVLICFLIASVIFGLVVYLLGKRPEKGALQVTASIKAQVYVDAKLVGETPLCLCEAKDMLNAGEYTIRLVPKEGNFEPFQRKITISPKVLTVVDRTFSQTALSQASIITLSKIDDKNDAQISVISFPTDAQVYLDSELVGQSPVLLKNITESDHEIKVVRQGYKDKTVRIKTVLGYKLETVIYLGIDPQVATSSATLISSPSAQTVAKEQTIIILDTPTGFLRVRENPNVSSAEIGRVNPDEIFVLLDEQNGWYKIKLKDGVEGWVSSQYARKTS